VSALPPAAPDCAACAARDARIAELEDLAGELREAVGVHGYDGAKKVNGRKRHLLVDTLGIVLRVHVTAASAGDRDGAAVLPAASARSFPV
jgi:putative transposase